MKKYHFILVILFTLLTSCQLRGKHTPINSKTSEQTVHLLTAIYERQKDGLLSYSIADSNSYASTLPRKELFQTIIKDGITTDTDWNYLRNSITKEHEIGKIILIEYHFNLPFNLSQTNTGNDKLYHERWKEIITDGTPLNTIFLSKIDSINSSLNTLSQGKIPILWMPRLLSEAPQTRIAINGCKKLWTQTYQRFTEHHQTDNLLWVWSPINTEGFTIENTELFPGLDQIDIVTIKQTDFNLRLADLNTVKKLTKGKPILLVNMKHQQSEINIELFNKTYSQSTFTPSEQ